MIMFSQSLGLYWTDRDSQVQCFMTVMAIWQTRAQNVPTSLAVPSPPDRTEAIFKSLLQTITLRSLT